MKKVTDVHWKFWVKFLRGTNLGVNGPKSSVSLHPKLK